MAITFQYNKTSLQALEKNLKMRQRTLPTLQNKESALRLEVKKAKKEIEELRLKSEAKGLTLIPLRLYLKHGFIKMELGVCRGKAQHDKRDALKKKALKRDMERGDY